MGRNDGNKAFFKANTKPMRKNHRKRRSKSHDVKRGSSGG